MAFSSELKTAETFDELAFLSFLKAFVTAENPKNDHTKTTQHKKDEDL